MTVAHTPGPWGFRLEAVRTVIFHKGEVGERALAVGAGAYPAHIANARLIAAAPKLLEALVAVHAPYATLTDEALDVGILMEFGPPKPEKGAALLLARAAIAKATGDTPA